jgi:hypothetical protein
MNLLLQCTLITAGFAGAYVGLRNIPVQNCEFLHYETTGTTVDGDEVCSANAPPLFMDLTRLRFPVNLELRFNGPLEPGRTAYGTLTLVTDGGEVLLPHELAVVHTEKVHLMLVDNSLEDYHHLHPEPMGPNGQWRFSFTPREGGDYRAIAEAVPLRTRRQVSADTWLEVGGAPLAPLLKTRKVSARHGDYRFTLDAPAGKLPRGRDNPLSLTVRHAGGGPVELQEIMGDYAHMVAFDKDRAGYAHLHPVQTGKEEDPTAPRMGFTFNSAKPGLYRLWAQVKLDGQEIAVPFDLSVE